jgi:hypothetical protein
MRVIEGEVVSRKPLSGYGAAPTLSDAERVILQQKMNATVLALRSGFKLARAKVNTTPNAVVGAFLAALTGGLSLIGIQSAPTEVKKNVGAALNTLERSFESIVPPAVGRVMAGELEPDRWFRMAEPYVDGIKGILDTLGESGTANLMAATLADVGKDIAAMTSQAREAVKRTLDFMPLILTVIGAVAVVTLIKEFSAPVKAFLPQPKRLAGYGRRRF